MGKRTSQRKAPKEGNMIPRCAFVSDVVFDMFGRRGFPPWKPADEARRPDECGVTESEEEEKDE